MADCENLQNCGFFKKHQNSLDSAVKGFIVMYCKSEKQHQCKRKEYKKANGVAPSDDMMPNGLMVKV